MSTPVSNPGVTAENLDLLDRLLADEGLAPVAIGRRPDRAEFPLSSAQHRLWLLDQLEPGVHYNDPFFLRLRGSLDVVVLGRSLNQIVRRHATLRAVFGAVDGVPFQTVAAEIMVPLLLEDFTGLPEAEREAAARHAAVEDSTRPFDLRVGPLLRARLLRLGAHDHILALTFHHIASDGWSRGVLLRELAALYTAFVAGEPDPLPELPIEYADFAHWQRQRLAGEELGGQLAYWKERLAGAPTLLELPADRPRPAVRSYRGGRRVLALSPAVTDALKALSRREGCSLFMTLLAAFQTWLARQTGREDIVVGSPIAARTQAEIEGLIGYFVNTLVLRGDLSGDPTFRELLGRMREVALGAFEHQELPFERLVEELQPARDESYAPLFQVMFVLQNPPPPASAAGLTCSPLPVDNGTAKFDLTVFMEEAGDGLTATFEFDRELFDDASVARWQEHFRTLLESIAAQPEQRLSQLPMMTGAERRKVLVEWNDTRTDFPADRCIHALFEEQAAHTPDAVALVFGGEEMTYGELDAKANQLAHLLASHGVGPDVLVGLCVERSLELIIATLGILKAGGAYVPLDAAYPKKRLAAMLDDSRPALVLTQSRFVEALPEGAAGVVCLDTQAAQISALSTKKPACAATPENLAYVMYTSGSTGQPKGVMVTQRGVVRLVRNTDYARLTAGEVFLQLAPVSFDAATFEIWGSLLNGARLVIAPPGVLSLAELGGVIRQHGVTTLWLTAGLFHAMIDERIEDLRPLRQLLAGGDVLSPVHVAKALRALPGCRLINGYGPTETTTFACCHTISERDLAAKSIPIGRPIANTQAYILDAALVPVPVGVPGQLYIGGPGVARGYLHAPELTAARFIADPFGTEQGAQFYRTGDLGRWRIDGTIEFLGRSDDQVKIRGFRIELGEIEAALVQHGSVRQAVVAVCEDKPREKRVVAYCVMHEGSEHGGPELRRFLQQRLPDYMLPSAFVCLPSIPLTPNGKVDLRALPAPVRSIGDGEGDSTAPRTPTERVVAETWCEVLRVAEVGVHENFFELGGHSLLAIQVVSRLRAALATEFPLRSFLEKPTVAEIAARIDEAGEIPDARPAMRRVDREGRLPLSFAQQRLWLLDQMDGKSATYNIPTALALKGVLDVRALEQALSEIVRRHEALRTTFGFAADAQPFQIIVPHEPLRLAVVEMQSGPAAHAISEAVQRPFDLATGPLVRVQLLRTHEDEHILLLEMHHIVSDGWSIGVFARELSELYPAFSAGHTSPLPELPVQYVDFACWQRSWVGGEVLEKQLAYWKEKLAGASFVLDLPTDRPRPPRQSHRGALLRLTLPAILCDRLRELSRREGVTLFTTLLAAFHTLLHRYSGQEEILVGSPSAGRDQIETEGLMGFFIHLLVIRGDLSGNPTFRTLLQRVREAAMGAFAHQDVPFERLVEELQSTRDMDRSPLCQVVFVLQNSPAQEIRLPGLTVSALPVHSGTAKFDVTLGLEEAAGGLAGYLEYRTDLFDEVRMRRLIEDFEAVLEGIVADPVCRLADLPLLPAGEGVSFSRTYVGAVVPTPDSSRQENARTYVAPRSETERLLTKVWEETLGVQPIGVTDDFFDLGGHSLAGIRLVAKLETVFKKVLPLSAVFEARTVRRLAVVLSGGGWSSPRYSLVPIQPAGSRPCLFGVHDLHYQHLARRLGSDQPIYGLRYGLAAHSRDGIAILPGRIEDLAAHYIGEMQSLQPEGPYHLMGLSFGGIVAFEMALQLHANFQEVGLLAVFDTFLSVTGRRLPFLGVLSNAVKLGPMGLATRARNRMKGWKMRHQQNPYEPHSHHPWGIQSELAEAYRPRVYAGKVLLFKARDRAPTVLRSMDPPELGWSRWVDGGLEIREVPGGHVTLLEEPNVSIVAQDLEASLITRA